MACHFPLKQLCHLGDLRLVLGLVSQVVQLMRVNAEIEELMNRLLALEQRG
jgi:hypothetical protein